MYFFSKENTKSHRFGSTMQLLYAMDIHTMYETLNDFFEAAEAVEKIHLSDSRTWDMLNTNREENKNYRVFRRRQFHWLQGVDQCNKWTQTCANVVVAIKREECWKYGTFSHSLLKVRCFYHFIWFFFYFLGHLSRRLVLTNYHCGQSITACSMRLLFTFSLCHVLRSVCLQFIAYKDKTWAFNNITAQLYKYCNQ